MKTIAAALALALTACAAEETPASAVDTDAHILPYATTTALAWTVVLDPSVPDWEAEELRHALADWQRLAPCPFVYELRRGATAAPDGPFPEPFTIEVRIAERLPKEPAVGWADYAADGGSVILLKEDAAGRWDFPRVVRHELGHAFHIPHGGAGVMQDPPKAGAKLGADDAAAYASLWCR